MCSNSDSDGLVVKVPRSQSEGHRFMPHYHQVAAAEWDFTQLIT